jgi:predicted FMN-binding regulatory protein PaiB
MRTPALNWERCVVTSHHCKAIVEDIQTLQWPNWFLRHAEILRRDKANDWEGRTGRENQEAWKVTDAPSIFIERLMKKITGIEIKIDHLEGKFKMNQEVAKGDREGVVQGF